jgi:DNA-binding response OmpR family regulator
MKFVLVVDDDIDLRASLKIGLEKEGFSVITAGSAEEAREILWRISVDGIVLDRMMTGTDGLTFLLEMREAGDETPVLMLTAMNGAMNAVDGLSGGADDYLAKPFHLKELVLRLDNILKKSEKAEPRMPAGLSVVDGEFFIGKKLLALSESEKKALTEMTRGEVVRMPPMPAKRFRDKILANLKNADIINIRGKGYKLVGKK